MKDSKKLPYSRSQEEWPRLIPTGRIVQDGGGTSDPYTSAGFGVQSTQLLNRLFPYRNAKRDHRNDDGCLTSTSNSAWRLHQRDQARGIHAGDRQWALFLSGRGDEILRPLEEEMQQAADAWNLSGPPRVLDRIDEVRPSCSDKGGQLLSTTTTSSRSRKARWRRRIQVCFLRNGK